MDDRSLRLSIIYNSSVHTACLCTYSTIDLINKIRHFFLTQLLVRNTLLKFDHLMFYVSVKRLELHKGNSGNPQHIQVYNQTEC